MPVNAGGANGLQTFYASQGNYTALDNHELGNGQLINGGSPASVASASGNGSGNTANDVNTTGTFINQTTGFKTLVQAYSDYQPIKETIVNAPDDARSNGTQQLYNSQQWGKNVININTDTRSYRDDRLKVKNADGTDSTVDDTGARADAAGRTLLGKTQLAWLKQTLLDAQKNGTAWKFVSVSDPIDQIDALAPGSPDSGKSWIGGYRAERNELLNFIADNKINNVVFLACDDHQNRINEINYTDKNGVVKTLANALSIVDGPMGAGGPDTVTDHSFANIKSLADTLAGKEKAAGLNPIGLDANFMGLNNLKREFDPTAATAPQPIDFYSPDTFNFTTFDISADGKTLGVNVQGVNSVAANTFPETSTTNPVRSILSFNLVAGSTSGTPTVAPFDNKNIDIRDIVGKASFGTQVSYEAAYANTGGFYTVDDLNGTINGKKPGEIGYAEAAINRAVANISKTQSVGSYQFDGGKILAPYLIANGSASDFLAKNKDNVGSLNGSQPNAYFIFADANPDKIEHIKAIGNYQFAAEDTFGGGDKDFNDFIIQLNYKPA